MLNALQDLMRIGIKKINHDYLYNLENSNQPHSNTNMNFSQYQQQAKQYAIYKDRILYPTLGLASEAGEVCGKVKKVLRDSQGFFSPEDKEQIRSELGDVLWYIAAVCSDLDLDMNTVASDNIIKLQDRMNRNKIKGSGDNR
jgi:NTP pyrophosphatase (non-canonical NTP hydrolase)